MIAIVVTIEQTIFTDVLRLVITINRIVITYVAISNVVISVATYIPIQPALFIAGGLLALRCQLSCTQVTIHTATELCLEEEQRKRKISKAISNSNFT